MRCFELPQEPSEFKLAKQRLLNSTQHPIANWLEQFGSTAMLASQLKSLTNEQRSALAKLIPLLLCGEQSAVHIFNQESMRLYQNVIANNDQQAQLDYTQALTTLANIEADERYHEQALQHILAALPADKEQHKIKRQAQLFYTQIAHNTATLAEHFQMIAKLDRCVCILMDAVSKSSLQGTELAKLFELIKKDEAKHVGFARKHSLLLQSHDAKAATEQLSFDVQSRLVSLLKTHSATFEHLQIDSQALFERLLYQPFNQLFHQQSSSLHQPLQDFNE